MSRLRIALVAALLGLATALPAAAQPASEEERTAAEDATDPAEDETVADDSAHLELPPFPGLRNRDAVRLHVQSRFAPSADIGPGRTTLYRPELRGRVTLPISEDAVVRFSGRGGFSRYEFHGRDAFRYGGMSLLGDSLDLFRTRIAAQGAYRLSDPGSSVLADGEVWSLLGGLYASSDFEGGVFEEGLSGGGGMAVGYEIHRRLRVAAGVAIESSIEDGGVDVSPMGSLRWNITDALTLRDHGLGLQLEYRLSPRLEIFASGYRATDSYRLRDVGAFDELTLRDRQVLAGAGFEWKISRRLRINTEVGAITWRKLRVHSDDLGTLVSRSGDPSPYFEVRFEVRP